MVNLPNIKIIGLTGMSGAGKSTVCGLFALQNLKVIDCDAIARETAGERDFLIELQSRFPDNLLKEDGSLDREITAKTIFNDSTKLRLYDRIIFPYIVYRVISGIKSAGKDVVLDAPTLFESGLDMICTKTVGVTASLDICAARIVRRDRITRKQALERLSIQHKEEFFKRRCGYIIENNGEFSDFVLAAEALIKKMKGEI